ncbi:CPBP family intramembrane metalloprotease [Pseudomonas cichorii]|uniref:CPBP family intramembrane metalloprotease n=1 Tax=Pseudomonas lijiangensis TaxID=2995658 RepID=A0ABX8HWY4_9PSED|nr:MULTISPECIES: CPBP family intramembrane glutamic endopeptidase [Pseudomonas syringae group]MBX8489110.1 CPBP family intramembrane metalloprotease [Pseudomonas cichorii]MBX8500578.1 CPBP family intramembrane metalloprotease [Pseudomonas lijiangensis]MBX8504964.1 CPBP family intramembrane metalloprotease [Pseudomonas lijiangensis]MBX8520883.1 CPBP family intramembrane metalloprotease [Pseudomonas cichorii]MBX8545275.1 CPBP family intramembrane metalloprotease [Pseudomonas cichorii]
MTPTHRVFFSLLGLGYVIALLYGQLQWPAALAVGLLLIAGLLVRQRHGMPRGLGHAAFIVTGLALAAHLLPGFNSAKVFDAVRFSPEAVPFSMSLNLDKPLIGFWVLLFCPWILTSVATARSLKVAALSLITTTVLCMTVAAALGVTGWSVKWPEHGTLWLLNNLLLVTITEELFFRAYLQGALQQIFNKTWLGSTLAIGIAAILFGLAHFGSGWQWVLLASLAGVGYGIAYRFGGLQAAVISHFGLNLIHFGLFTYPMLDR